jgi:transposase
MMTGRNRYVRQAHVSEAEFRQLLRLFVLDLEATTVAYLTGLSRRTVNRYFHRLRQRLAAECERAGPLLGDIEVDESYFGPRRVRGKVGRGAGGKTIVFGLFKRDGQVYTHIVPNARKRTIQPIITGRVPRASVIHSDGWHAYDGIAALGYAAHRRVRHRGWVLVDRRHGTHINGIESFWSTAKTRLARRRGIRPEHFVLHLKECEYRFNHRRENLYRTLLALLRKQPLK